MAQLEAAVENCSSARSALTEALAGIDSMEDADSEEALRPVADALEQWRDAQQQFMTTVEASDVPDVSTAAMLLKMNHGIDATEARRGLPGVPVDGADQPFDLDTSGVRGTALMNAAMNHVDSAAS